MIPRRRLYVAEAFVASEWTASATRDDGATIEWDGVDVFPLREPRLGASLIALA